MGCRVKILLSDPSFLTSTLIDGNQIKSSSQTGPEESSINPTEVANVSPGGEKTSIGKGKVEIGGAFGQQEDKAEFSVNKVVHKDKENGSTKMIGIEAKPTDSLYVICANVQVKGSITATGDINGNQQSARATLPKKLARMHADLALKGNVKTNEEGKATVYFDSYLGDTYTEFSYQLTTIGSFARAIIDEEIRDSKMVIATDQPYTKVSWLIQATKSSN